MRTLFKIIATFILSCALVGCRTDAPQTVDLKPLATEIGRVSDANADLRAANVQLAAANAKLLEENERLKAVLRADADAGLLANEKGWLPFERYVWRHQISLLPVSPDAGTVDKWNDASTLYEAGGESAMQSVIHDLQTSAGQLNSELGKAQKEVATAQAERDEAVQAMNDAVKAAQEAQQNLEAAVAKAKADERARLEAETRAWQARSANWLGGILGIAALGCIAGMIFLPEAAKLFRKAGIVAGLGSVALLALARFLSSPWFDVAWKVTLATGAVCLLAWWLWELRAAILRARQANMSKEKAMVADTIIRRLDTYYDNDASSDAKLDMDAKLWPALQSEGPAYDAAVKRIKAAQCDLQNKQN